MADSLHMIIMGVLTFGILVTIHEFGHFWVARRCGVKVVCFSIGFGKSLFSWHDKSGTKYTVAMIPLGGYVRMVDEREGEVSPEDLPYAFNNKTVWARIAIVAAGPLANFLLAIVAYWFVFLSGVTGVAPMVKSVAADSLAAEAGLVVGQEIVAVDGVSTPTWRAVLEQLLYRLGDTGTVNITTQYPGSDIVYDSNFQIDRWLSDAEEPDLLKGMGLGLGGPAVPVHIDKVVEGAAAAEAGMHSNDVVESVDGKSIGDWGQWVALVQKSAGQRLQVKVRRDGELVPLIVVPRSVSLKNDVVVGQVGVTLKLPVNYLRHYRYSPFSALMEAANKTWDTSVFTLESIGKLITGRISSKNLSGPITIAKVASTSAESGIEQYVGLLALLSISLGVLNLLPIPVLDGGHLLYFGVEAVTGKPVSERIQLMGTQIGLVLVLGVMVLAFYNDIMRL